MPKGMITRQPTKSGRHEGAKRAFGETALKSAKASLPGAKAPSQKKQAKAAKGYDPVAPARVQEILKRLDERYGGVTCALHHNSAWELLVATILSAQCTDVRVNMVTPVIFKKYPTIQHFAALKPEELEPDIKSTGFFRNKSKSVVGAAKKIIMLDWRPDEQASISVADLTSGEIVFAYSVNKKSAAHGKATTAEACAKHLKDRLDKGK